MKNQGFFVFLSYEKNPSLKLFIYMYIYVYIDSFQGVLQLQGGLLPYQLQVISPQENP